MAEKPKILYKYIGPKGAEEFLARPQLRYTDWRILDDLMEVMPGPRHLRDDEIPFAAAVEFQKNPKRSLAQHMERFQQIRETEDPADYERQLRDLFLKQPCTMFIGSLTERYDSGAMWGLYGGKHQGLVFGIKMETIERMCAGRPAGELSLGQVTYSRRRPQVAIRQITDEDRENLKQAVITKSEDWDYQREWRMVKANDSPDFLKWADVPELILGYEASKDVVAMAKKINVSGVSVYKAYPDPVAHRVERKVT